ncbi:LytR/AlgR family response regulator transcription factor [Caldinitratiruptor microaerophilus]|uniref:Stage 0 sporulation protein A homolog n=1 Tax=Caldinitratiruptor microaerophilus TaxID=671077 RepID=A0AA35CKD1_9FIRM|nr:LytTR family DNA-binding domain-containing protein [Caldinitratiruptor microaerophilus]BDG60914.1 DNA-binding response regulator [Caldinitratiruptor microaerophilus]
MQKGTGQAAAEKAPAVLKALIVDDEYPARMELRYRLEKYPDVEIIGEATSAREALHLIEALDYDVIFLDVQMPGVNGIELARQLRGREVPPRIVFVTAYENYAVPAFEMRAVDYLLKPIDDERLAETIQRLREARGLARPEPGEGEREGRRSPTLTWVLCERDERQIPVAPNEIVYIFSEGYNVYVQTHSERLVTRYTLQELTERLPSDQFFRCHRSYLVNIYQIREISPYFNGAYLLRMKDKNHSEVLVSRSNVKKLKELFAMD